MNMVRNSQTMVKSRTDVLAALAEGDVTNYAVRLVTSGVMITSALSSTIGQYFEAIVTDLVLNDEFQRDVHQVLGCSIDEGSISVEQAHCPHPMFPGSKSFRYHLIYPGVA
ncbi:hypothetical protein [Embleya hyalina]|uniref:Uncharacterized protein n=1 Tax=Embleya hyalina TaxID=516124 RepID=A0A401YYZ6_9ACTN|nr:hypothetical protein [Embleya hyalina]GCD99849.1 hypothetical protein EHYA_07571 [Embleya hyalina]